MFPITWKLELHGRLNRDVEGFKMRRDGIRSE